MENEFNAQPNFETQPPQSQAPAQSPAPVQQPSLPGVLALWQKSWQIYKSGWKTFVGISLIPAVLTFFFSLLWPGPIVDSLLLFSLTMVLFVCLMVISIWQTLALLLAVRNRQEAMDIRQAYQSAWPKLKSFVWISFLTGLVVFGGTLLLIVPGFIFAIWFAFAPYVLVDQGLKGTGAMRKSREYVKGNFWAVVWRFVGFGLFSLGLFLGIGIVAAVLGFVLNLISPKAAEIMGTVLSSGVSLLFTPFAVIYSYLLYEGLKRIKLQPGSL